MFASKVRTTVKPITYTAPHFTITILHCIINMGFRTGPWCLNPHRVPHNALQATRPCILLNIGYVSNETNTDVRMYTCRIYSSRDLDTLLHKVALSMELNMHWKNAGLYTLATKD